MSTPTERMRELPAPGERLAQYVIEREIGRGGMGRVYVANEDGLNRKVALKVLAPDIASDPVFRERFVRESRLAAAINHPHVIPIFRAGDEDGALFIAMLYVAGSLKEELRRLGALDLQRALVTVEQVGAALDAAHRSGLVHRDVKPANVLVQQNEVHALPHCYLTDFGISKSVNGDAPLTGTGQALGSPNYMAPEQIQGHAVDSRADVYGLGCVLFELLTGRVPYRRESAEATCLAHLHDPPPSARELRPDVPAAFDSVVATALAKSPSHRFPDCHSLATAARDAAGRGSRSAPPPVINSSAARTSPEPQSGPARVGGAVAANGGAGNGAPPAHVPPRPRPPAPAPHGPRPPVHYQYPTAVAPRRRRGWLIPVAIVLGALLLCAGGIAAALLLTGEDDGPSQAELDKAKRTLDRTERINKHLRNLTDQARAGQHASEAELLAQQRQAAALREAAERDIESDRELRESLVAANEQLEQAVRELRRARRGRDGALGAAGTALDNATDHAGDAEDIIINLGGASIEPETPTKPKVAAPVRLSLPGDASFRITPSQGARFESVASPGDVSGDGAGDVIVNHAGAIEGTNGLVVFGGTQRSANVTSLGDRGFPTLDSLGAHGSTTATPAGDIDDDGKADLAILGTAGNNYQSFFVVGGTDSTAEIDVVDPSSSLGSVTVPRPAANNCTTFPISTAAQGAGDVNGDGNPDLLITDPCAGPGGQAWVAFGPIESEISLGSLGGDGFAITGSPVSDQPGLGLAAAAGEDLNGDGLDDIVLGQPHRDGRATAYVIFGSESTDDVDVEALDGRGYSLTNSRADGAAGSSVALLEDMNGDGRGEVVVGAPEESTAAGSGSGAAYVVFGQKGARDVELSRLREGGFTITGPAGSTGAEASGLGWSAAAAGDVNGDGKPDLVLGSPGLSGGGIAYIVFGKDSSDPVALKSPGGGAVTIRNKGRADTVTVAGGHDIDGDDRDDVVIAPAWLDQSGLTPDAGGTAYVVGLPR